ncbi:MAG: hypothetical protein Q4E72_05095 [bacterium]|nr:hypothetical protein [bacterium]
MERKWIWLPEDVQIDLEQAVFVCFRKAFDLPALPKDYKVYLSADSRYKLYVNGRFIEAGPRKGDDQAWYVDPVNLSPFLTAGSNVIAVEVLHYPVPCQDGNYSVFRTEQPGLYIASEQEELFRTPWKCMPDYNRRVVKENPWFAPLQIYEDTRGEEALHGWTGTGFRDEHWFEAVERNEQSLPEALQASHLRDRPIPFLRRTPGRFGMVTQVVQSIYDRKAWEAFLSGGHPLTVRANSREIVEIGAEALTTAYLACAMTGGADAKITLLQAECYAEANPQSGNDFDEMPVKGDRTRMDGTALHGYTDTYLCHGKGTQDMPEVFTPFWFRTFRFARLTIETAQEPLTLQSLDFEEVGFPYHALSWVKTSDPSLDDIWQISERTLKRCMHETYEDCPFYEQLQYIMDARSQMLYTYASAADDRLARQCMEDFRHAAHPDGLLNSCYPNAGPHTIPGFSIYYIGMLYDHMMYFDDQPFLRRHMDTVEGILRYFDSHLDARGIVAKIGDRNIPGQSWSFIDWTKEWDATNGVPTATKQGPITMESLLYILGLQYAAALADRLGMIPIKEDYLCRMRACREAVQKNCTGKDGMLRDGPDAEEYSQHSQVFGILTGTLDADTGKAALLDTLAHPDRYAQCSVAMMPYLFRALEKCGLYGHTARLWDLWRNMLKKHLTTCEEEPVRSRSDCHAWGALALYELPAVILGVRPIQPGCAMVEISPQTQLHSCAFGQAALPGGVIHVEWRKEANEECRMVVSAEGNYTVIQKDGHFYALKKM